MRRVSLFISEELLAGLKALKAEHGTPEAESIRRALAMYLAEKGVLKIENSNDAPTETEARIDRDARVLEHANAPNRNQV